MLASHLCFVILWNKAGDFLYFFFTTKIVSRVDLLTGTAGLATDNTCGEATFASYRLLSKPLQDKPLQALDLNLYISKKTGLTLDKEPLERFVD